MGSIDGGTLNADSATQHRLMAYRGRAPALVTSVLLVVYVLTLAPGVTYWDAGEFLSAIKTLGIPHPPGTPLYILLGNVWGKAVGALTGFAYSINLLSAVSTALACGLLTCLMLRWARNAWVAVAGGIAAGLMSSVWLNANETEVYAPSLLVSILLFVVAERIRMTRERRWMILLAYLLGLGYSLQLSALVAAPAALFLAFIAGRDDVKGLSWRLDSRAVPWMMVVCGIGASAVLFMLVRAKHDPAINQGNPATWQAFTDVMQRTQYKPVSMLPRQAPWYIQIGNVFEYADWQIALGLHREAPPSWLRTPFTVVYALLAIAGSAWHRRVHKPSWQTLMMLFVTASLGVVVYLNMKAGPSYGDGFLPPGSKHEARERDYFFALAFACWGVWIGAGSMWATARLGSRGRIAGMSIVLLPAVLNWSAVDRRTSADANAARDGALRILSSSPKNAVVFAHGDNDTYPVWYAQQVEGIRKDVVLVTIPLLGAKWNREELSRRYRLLPDSVSAIWRGIPPTVASVCREALEQRREVVFVEKGDADIFTECR